MGWLWSEWSFMGGNWINPCGQEDGSPASTALNPGSCEIILLCLSPVVQPRADLAGARREEKEIRGRKVKKKKGWFYYGLVSWTTSQRLRVPQWVERRKKCYLKWRSERQNQSLASSKLLDWHISSSILGSLLHLLPACFLPDCSTFSHILICFLPPAFSPVMFP